MRIIAIEGEAVGAEIKHHWLLYTPLVDAVLHQQLCLAIAVERIATAGVAIGVARTMTDPDAGGGADAVTGIAVYP